MLATAVLSVVLLNAAFTLEEDADCSPPSAGGPHHTAEEDCCTAPALLVGLGIHDKMHQCMEESGMKKPEPGSVPSTAPDDATMDCMDQCLWKSMGIISDGGAMDNTKVQAKITEIYTGDWAAVAKAAYENCFDTAPSKVSASSTCKSGARQFIQCFTRELFINCPPSNWTDSDQCTQFKQIYAKCENKPAVFLLKYK